LYNSKLIQALELLNSQLTTESLAVYNGFDFAKLYKFRQIFYHNIDDTITDNELFSEEMLISKKNHISLSDNIYELLVQYYNAAYD